MSDEILARALRRWEAHELGFGDSGLLVTEIDRLCREEDLTVAEAIASFGTSMVESDFEHLDEIAMIEKFGRQDA